MEKIRVLFGTPEPIWYREADERLGYDLDINCSVSGAVTVYEYPSEMGEEAVQLVVKETAVAAVEECLHKSPFGKPLYSSKIRQQAILGKAIEDALLLKGIRAEAEIVDFKVENESKEELDALIKEYIKAATPKMYVDEMYKPNIFEKAPRQNYKDLDGWMNQGLGPAPVDEPCREPEVKPVVIAPVTCSEDKNRTGAGEGQQPQSFMEMMGDVMGMNSLNEGEEWTCPACKNSGNKGNFCTECGGKRPPFGAMIQGL